MKITKKMLDAYHRYRFEMGMPSCNESYNKSKGLPEKEAWNFIAQVHDSNFGMFPGIVTMAMIKRAGGQ